MDFTQNQRLYELWKDKDAMRNDFSLFNEAVDQLYKDGSDELSAFLDTVNNAIDNAPDDVEQIKRTVYKVLVDAWPDTRLHREMFEKVLTESNPDRDRDVQNNDEIKRIALQLRTNDVDDSELLLTSAFGAQDVINQKQKEIAAGIYNVSIQLSELYNCACRHAGTTCQCQECGCYVCRARVCPCRILANYNKI